MGPKARKAQAARSKAVKSIDFGSDSDFEVKETLLSQTSSSQKYYDTEAVNLQEFEAKDTHAPLLQGVPTVSYIVQEAKSARAECKKCNIKICKGEIRIGLQTEGDWGLFTKWQHLYCTIFNSAFISAGDIDKVGGYTELSEDNQVLVCRRLKESMNEVDSEYVALNPDELVRKEWTQSVEAKDCLLMPLLSYQKEGLAWMLHQETETDFNGGILADEMV